MTEETMGYVFVGALGVLVLTALIAAALKARDGAANFDPARNGL